MDYSPQNEISALKEQGICKIKCSHMIKCQTPGYQCPWVETLAELIFPNSFILQTSVVSLSLSKNCFCEDPVEPQQLQPEVFLVLIESGQNADAEWCSASTVHTQHEAGGGLVFLLLLFVYFWKLQNLDEFVYRKEGYISGTNRCQMSNPHFYITEASWHSTKQFNLF